ncbi:MAG: TetR/AcrR family transcriptional regulator [Solirubrobacterales bacterium]
MADSAPQATRAQPGRHSLSREFIVEHQRARIIAALAAETVEKGYRAVTVADIVRRAGIARNTFYENFSSKEDCFLSASEFAVESALGRVVDAAAKVDAWPDKVSAGLAAFLHYVAGEPALARTCIVEALSAGPAAVERYERSIQAFVPFFQLGRKVSAKGGELPGTLEETIVGGIFWILYQRITMGQIEQIEALLDELVEFSLTPYLGAEAAKRVAAEAPSASATD